jgi:hypothetical protein
MRPAWPVVVMLAERVQELLSAAVDGELTPRQREAVDQLLSESSEARELYCEMKRDAERLQHMRRIRLSQDFPAVILKRVAERKPVPARNQNPIARWMPVWANSVAAAAVILAVCGATTLVVIWNEQQKKNGIAKQDKDLPEKAPAPKLVSPSVAVKPANNADENTRVEKVPFMPAELVKDTSPQSPVRPDEPKPLLTGPGNSPTLPLTKVELPKLPAILAMKELDQPAVQQRLLEALKNEPLIQIDLFCKDPLKASERLQGAFKSQKLVVDAVAQECMRLKVAKVQYIFYVENLTPEDVEKVLQSVAMEDRKSEPKQFGKVVLNSFTTTQLRQLLGVEPKWLQNKSLPSAKAYENLVLVLAAGKVTSSPATSKEIKHFVETRKERRPGSVPVLISVRESE